MTTKEIVMNTLLWICQILLAIVYVVSGAQKSTQSKDRMIATGQTGVRDYPIGFIRFIATCELLGAMGLVLPRAVGILPILTPLAAIGLGIIMIGAARAHARLHEPRNVAINLVLLTVLAFVVIGRLTEA
jgi:uncharacterized membrane protein YphA (DoxX/SURF4 family)